MALNTIYICLLYLFAFVAVSSSNYAIGWKEEGNAPKDYILDVDFDNMIVTPLFPLEIHYINSFGSAFDEKNEIVYLMAETYFNSNKFGFYSIDIKTNTTTSYDLPSAILPFESTLRWISTTPDVVYIFSWKDAYTFSYSDNSFTLFLNFSTTFADIVPENAQSPTPYYFDTNANVVYCYFVYYGSNNKVQMTRVGVSMQGEVTEKESITCIPGHVPYFDISNNNTYSITQISKPIDEYNYVQTTTQNAKCTESKTIFSSPMQMECYLWDSANNRMLLSNFEYSQGPSICKYTNNVWTLSCQVVDYQLEDIYTAS